MTIQEYIKDNILLFDGAMGTYFSQVSKDTLYKCEYANITAPQSIKEIHRRYLLAGATAIKTNTFSVISSSGENFSPWQLIKEGYKIATEVAKDFSCYVFCDIGPIHAVNSSDLISQYKQIADVFLDQGGKNFLFETFPEIETPNEIAKYIKSKCPDAFIIASLAIDPDGFSAGGGFGQDMLKNACDEIDSVGFNCICGPHHMNLHIKQITGEKRPVIAMPNAGYPTVIGSRVSYEKSPYYFANQIMVAVENGARIVGGCCGTTPEFIAEIAKKLQTDLQKSNKEKIEIVAKPPLEIRKSEFFEKLISGKKPIAVELDPPKNARLDSFLNSAKSVVASGADIITIADCPVARARMDSSLLACKIKSQLGVEVLPHMTCRDRNINASKALLLGLSAEEINNVLIVTGDPVPTAQRNEVKMVYEFNSRLLLKHISTFNQTLLDSPMYLYGALNINAKIFKHHIQRAKEKIANGAVALFTQPAFSSEAMENLKIAKEELGVPIVGGIMPVVSYNNACFINSEVPGIAIPQEMVERYFEKTREESAKIAVEISATLAREMKDYVDGYYLITPFQRTDIIGEVIKEIGKIR